MKNKIKSLRKEFNKSYNKYADDFNEMVLEYSKLNNKLVELSKKIDELFDFMEKSLELRENIQ